MARLPAHAVLRCRHVLVAAVCALALTAADRTATTAAQPRGQAVAWAIFVDDLHLDFRNTGRLRDLLRQLAKLVVEGDAVAMATSGPSQGSFGFTAAPGDLQNAIKKTSGNGLRFDDVIPATKSGAYPYEVIYRTDVALSAAQGLLASLIERDGPENRALLYISNGYNAFAAEISDPALPRPPTGFPNLTPASLLEKRTTLATTAAAAGIHVFVIDPRVVINATLDPSINPEEWRRYFAVTQDSLRAIAEQSGGKALLRQEDFVGGFGQINAAMRR